MYTEYLKFSGFDVVEAGNGMEALARAADGAPDIILMDLSLPVMDGWEATRRLKADERTASIPVVALTGHALAGISEARQARRLRRLRHQTVPARRSRQGNQTDSPVAARRCRRLRAIEETPSAARDRPREVRRHPSAPARPPADVDRSRPRSSPRCRRAGAAGGDEVPTMPAFASPRVSRRPAGMPSPVPMSCSSRSEKSGTGFRLKSGLALGPVVERGDVARGAADRLEDPFAVTDGIVDRPAADGRQKTHERLEVVDAAAPCQRVADVFGIGSHVAPLHLPRR